MGKWTNILGLYLRPTMAAENNDYPSKQNLRKSKNKTLIFTDLDTL